ncbi:MAG: 2OG-Fe(II) oxygenase [Pseudomonadota bacterium]
MTVSDQVLGQDWARLSTDLDEYGHAVTSPIIDKTMCGEIRGLYDDPAARFRSTITMARYNFGRGAYKYFDYPLPPIVNELRQAFYAPLANIANQWTDRLGLHEHWPPRLEDLSRQCHNEGQVKPTPLLLRYEAGDYNCLHQDLYGDIHFPLQVVLQLSEPGEEFHGGELVLVENRPRMQSIPRVITPEQGAAVILPVRHRPARGAKGWRRTQMRHGVSQVTDGLRFTLGLIFHDAA